MFVGAERKNDVTVRCTVQLDGTSRATRDPGFERPVASDLARLQQPP